MLLNLSALRAHLSRPELVGLADLPFFRQHTMEATANDHAHLARVLQMAWGAEYTLRVNVKHDGSLFTDAALCWILPQAWHAVQFTLQAFLYTTGMLVTNRRYTLREAGRLVVKNAYPRNAAFYAAGVYGDFSTHRLPLAHCSPGSGDMQPEADAQASVARMLHDCRKGITARVRTEVMANPNTMLRKADGTPKVMWKLVDWQQLTWRLGYTTIFDLLDTQRDAAWDDAAPLFPTLAARSPARIRQFVDDLVYIVNYLNGIHEAYVLKAIGWDAYAAMVAALPAHLRGTFVDARLAANA